MVVVKRDPGSVREHGVAAERSRELTWRPRYARELADAWTTSADVQATKPAPDLVRAALDRVDGGASGAVMVGDTPWDVKAALAADVPTLAVVTGGFSKQELHEAGAAAVFESVAELRQRLDETGLR